MALVDTYAADSVSVLLGGWRIEGWDRVSIIFETPQFKIIKGIRGKNTRVRNPNTAATVEIELASGNDASKVLDKVVSEDMRLGTANFNLQIKDLLGHEVFFSNEAFVEGWSRKDYEEEATSRIFKVHCLSSSLGSSGGNSFSQITERIRNLF